MWNIFAAALPAIVLFIAFIVVWIKGVDASQKTTYRRIFYIITVAGFVVYPIGQSFETEYPTILGVGVALLLVGSGMGIIALVAREKYHVKL